MDSNKQFIINAFEKCFGAYKEKNIFLYGTNANTEFIVNQFPDYNIIGLLDGTKKNELMFGKYIYDIEDIPKLNPDLIIIVARATTVRIITKRIGGFCREHHIKLFDVGGNPVLEEKSFESKNPYFTVDMEALKRQIAAHEAVSFDIFDTLIMRRVLYPRDVFDILANRIGETAFDFKQVRIEAEQALYHRTHPTLDEIYDKIRTEQGLSQESADTFKEMEIAVEKEVLLARKAVKELLEYASALKKKVFLISDMYLEKGTLKDLLQQAGITGYEDIFVSCEHACGKTNGLFRIYKQEVPAKSYLHIGDNEYADGVCAEAEGIDTFLIKSAYDMAYISSYGDLLEETEDFNSRLHTGIFLSEIFNDPFALQHSNGKYCLKKAGDIGWYTAPVITEFMLWFMERIIRDQCENVLLASRDGFLIEKLYKIAAEEKKLPAAIYFLTSRMACIAAGVMKKEDIDFACGLDFSESPEKLLEKRFFVDKQYIKDYDGEEYDSIREYVAAHTEVIYQASRKCRENYQKYVENIYIEKRCNGEGCIEKHKPDFSKKTAFFDFASSGTSQMFLERILHTKLYGCYFLKIQDDQAEKKKLAIASMQSSPLAFEKQSNLYNKYGFMETILTSGLPSLKGFSEKGEPVYVEEYRTPEDIRAIEEIHACIMQYFGLYLKLYNSGGYHYSEISDRLYGCLDGSKTVFQVDYLASAVFRDECNGREYGIGNMVE